MVLILISADVQGPEEEYPIARALEAIRKRQREMEQDFAVKHQRLEEYVRELASHRQSFEMEKQVWHSRMAHIRHHIESLHDLFTQQQA